MVAFLYYRPPQTYGKFEQAFATGLKRYQDSDAYSAYALYPDRCVKPRSANELSGEEFISAGRIATKVFSPQ